MWNDIKKSRFNSIVDQIDFYQWVKMDKGSLSASQKRHLSELRDMVSVFGNRADKWFNLANELLA